MTTIRVLLADDHAVLRTGLAMLLNAQPDLEVVGEVGDGEEAAILAREIQPDVVIMDLTMGRHSGLEAIAVIRQAHPAMRVLVLSMHTDVSYVRTASGRRSAPHRSGIAAQRVGRFGACGGGAPICARVCRVCRRVQHR